MRTFRTMVSVLMGIPIGLLAVHLFYTPLTYDSDALMELAFLVFGVPILMLNFWAWFEPEIIEFYF